MIENIEVPGIVVTFSTGTIFDLRWPSETRYNLMREFLRDFPPFNGCH